MHAFNLIIFWLYCALYEPIKTIGVTVIVLIIKVILIVIAETLELIDKLSAWISAMIFNIIMIPTVPLFYIFYIIIYKPVQLPYLVARRMKLESYLRLVGIFPILLGVLLISL